MKEDILKSGVDEAARVPVAQSASTRATATPTAPAADTLLMRRFSKGSVRIADTVSLSISLLVSIFGSSLAAGQSLKQILAVRVSIQTLIVGAALLVVWRVFFWATGMYQPRQSTSQLGFLLRAPLAVSLSALPVALTMFFGKYTFSQIWHASLLFAITGLLLMGLNRVVLFTFYDSVQPALRKKRNVVVVGTGPRAFMLTQQLLAHPSFEYQVCGFVDSDPQPDCKGLAPVLGPLDDLENILMRRPVDEVLIALPLKSAFADVQQAVAMCGHAGVKALYSVDLFQSKIAKNTTVDEETGVRGMEMVHSDHRLLLKDIFDRTAALFGIILLLPVFLVIALAIKFTSKGPVLFRQERWGKNKRTFGMMKFRSMVVDAEARMAALEKHNEFGGPMFKMKNDPRVTKVGQFLRRTSLDELPQLFNVLRGEMSLVGPRPLPNRDVALFSETWLMRRFSVKPGITGLWQVSGRSETDFDQTIRLDLHYIDHWNLPLDLKILAKTVSVVFRGKGAY
ncbi:sugar transferase [Terriglobus albidus]|uniref:sugar transferase n=1 Tax=Terriglobus albidus TaxID=1592106 RepID=UPI0021DF47CA|nr:sugar transferase [Terriglobus albidus]